MPTSELGIPERNIPEDRVALLRARVEDRIDWARIFLQEALKSDNDITQAGRPTAIGTLTEITTELVFVRTDVWEIISGSPAMLARDCPRIGDMEIPPEIDDELREWLEIQLEECREIVERCCGLMALRDDIQYLPHRDSFSESWHPAVTPLQKNVSPFSGEVQELPFQRTARPEKW